MAISSKKIIFGLAATVILALMYFGAYLPLKKSQLWIQALVYSNQGKIQSVRGFIDLFSPALNFYSPVGQDEVVSYYFGNLVNIISQQSNGQVIDFLVKESEKWTEPILQAKKGFVYSQNLYNFAMLYGIAAQKLKSDVYLQKSLALFTEGLKNSPNRFIFLAGLLNVYQLEGDKGKVKETGEIILKYWPDNDQVRKIVNSL